MNRHQRFRQIAANVRERLIALGQQTGAAFQHARTQQVDFKDFMRALLRLRDNLEQRIRNKPSFSQAQIRLWLYQHGRKLVITAGIPLLGLVLLVIVHQQISLQSDLLVLKPAQLTAIESLIQDSKSSNTPSIASPLTDNDLETMRVILQNRGISTNILRLSLDQGIRIELQADQVPFAQWIAFLEEIASRWQVYPIQITLQANEQPGSVSVRGTLQQTQVMP